MIVYIKRLMKWCTCVAKAKDRGRLSSLQSSSFLSSGTSSTLVFVKDGWELNFPLLDRFQVINRCKVAQYVQGDGCMIQDCWTLILSAKRLMSRNRRAVPPVKPRHWTVIYICFTSHCFIWSEFIALQHYTTIRHLIRSLLRKYQKIYEWSKRAGAPVKPWQGS